LDQSLWGLGTDGKKTGNNFEGWSVEGMARFNELKIAVTEDHRQPHTTGVEEQLKEL
jgi:hypothetical protein